MSVMGPEVSTEMLRSASLAAVKAVQYRRMRLLRSQKPPMTCRKALPLDFSESRPFEASLNRNIKAAVADGATCHCM